MRALGEFGCLSTAKSKATRTVKSDSTYGGSCRSTILHWGLLAANARMSRVRETRNNIERCEDSPKSRTRRSKVLRQTVSPSRRLKSRIETLGGVWVYWRCGERDDTSRVLNLGVGGLFIETRKPTVVGTNTKLEFLVQEGQIRAEAVVQHVRAGHGLGLKFTALSEGDCPRLAALLSRLRNLSP